MSIVNVLLSAHVSLKSKIEGGVEIETETILETKKETIKAAKVQVLKAAQKVIEAEANVKTITKEAEQKANDKLLKLNTKVK